MSDHPLSPIPASGVDQAYVTLISAYRNDPVHRWLYPDDDVYSAKLPALIDAVGGSAFGTSTAWRQDENGAVALWVPPGVEPDAERIATVLLQSVSVDKHPDVFGALEQTDAARPEYPHWYLPFFGVESSQQGRGLGTRLLEACLEYVDLGGLPAYLLAPNPRNIAYFERFGFVVTGQTDAGSAPPLFMMNRAGRRP